MPVASAAIASFMMGLPGLGYASCSAGGTPLRMNRDAGAFPLVPSIRGVSPAPAGLLERDEPRAIRARGGDETNEVDSGAGDVAAVVAAIPWQSVRAWRVHAIRQRADAATTDVEQLESNLAGA